MRKAIKQLVAHSGKMPKRPSPTSPAGSVNTIIKQCSVLRGLVARARETGQLRHTYRLILLYTLGRLGNAGAKALHQAIAACSNYSQERTQSYLDKLDTTIPPLSCRRIREWLEEDEKDAELCSCEVDRHTPLDGILAAGQADSKRSNAPSPKPALSDSIDEWDAVREDMFQSEDKAEDT